MRHSYRVWIGSLSFDVKASDATEAKRDAAHQYRNRRKAWDETISSIMKRARISRKY